MQTKEILLKISSPFLQIVTILPQVVLVVLAIISVFKKCTVL